jgi:hypothetical protein
MNYNEPDFETRALQHSKVKLTWEDEEPERKKVLRRNFNPDQVLSLSLSLSTCQLGEPRDVQSSFPFCYLSCLLFLMVILFYQLNISKYGRAGLFLMGSYFSVLM